MGVELSVLMVAYNAADHLADTLTALTGPAAPSVDFEVLVTDNDSTDGAAEVAERILGPGAVQRLGRNSGFAHGVNRAADRASGEYLLLLNPDARPEPGAVDALLDHLRAHPDHGIVGGRTVDVHGRPDPRSCFARITPWSVLCWATGASSVWRRSRVFDPESLGSWERDSVRHVDVVSGGFLLVSAALWRELGGFDETYLIYGEDQDLCLRAAALGARPSITPDAVVCHDIGASSTSTVGRDVLVLTGRATVVREHLGPWASSCLAVLRFGVLLRSVAERAAGKRRRWSGVWARRHEWERGWPSQNRSVLASS